MSAFKLKYIESSIFAVEEEEEEEHNKRKPVGTRIEAEVLFASPLFHCSQSARLNMFHTYVKYDIYSIERKDV